MVDPQLRSLARRLAALEKQRLRSKQPTLGFSSIEDGAIMAVDVDSILKMIIGKQFDDTQTFAVVSGPVPPTPSDAQATEVLDGVKIRWDGTFVAGAVCPMDFSRVEVHVSTDSGFTAEFASTLVGTFETPRGGEVFVSLPSGTYYTKLVTRAQSGQPSSPSGAVEFDVETVADIIQISDGLPPSGSPTPEVISGIGAFFIRWSPPSNPDPMRFEVHVSDTTGFTADSTTLVMETGSYGVTIRRRPGTPTDEDDLRFSYGVPYYFVVIAKDEDDAASQSAESEGILYPITGPDIAVNTLTAENIAVGSLTGDLFSGTMILGSTISTGALDEDGNIVGARVELGPAGLMNFDANNNAIAKLPTDPDDEAYIQAHMRLLSADVMDNFSMFGTNNQISKDAQLILSEGVTPPSNPPVLSASYDTVQLDTTDAVPPHVANTGFDLGTFALNSSQITSMAWDDTWNSWNVIQQKGGGFRMWRFTAAGDVYLNFGTGDPWVDDYNDKGDAFVTDSPGGVSFLHSQGADWYIWGKTVGGTDVINKIPNSWIVNEDQSPALAYDYASDKYMLVQNNNAGAADNLHIRRFTLNTGSGFPNATSSSVLSCELGSALGYRVNGLTYGTQVTSGGASRYAWATDTYVTYRVVDTSGNLMGDNGSYEYWGQPTAMKATAHNGSQFASVNSSGKITFYENYNWPESNTTTHIGVSAYDSDIAGDPANPHTGQTAGQHETPVGAIATISQPRRAKLQITMPETPDSGGDDDVDKWRLYFYRGTSSTPVAANFDYIDQIGSPTAPTSKTIFADPSGVSPPGGIFGQVGAINNFPGANPARFLSTGSDGGGPLIELVGNGSGRMGPYNWDDSGDQIDGDPTYDTGWVSFAPGAGAAPFASGTTLSADYRRIGKMVTVRMTKATTAARDTSGSGSGDFTNVDITGNGLPAAVRPPYTVEAIARLDQTMIVSWLTTAGIVVWGGGFPRNYPSGSVYAANFVYFLD